VDFDLLSILLVIGTFGILGEKLLKFKIRLILIGIGKVKKQDGDVNFL